MEIDFHAILKMDENENELKELIKEFEERKTTAIKEKDKEAMLSLQGRFRHIPLVIK